ncbi:type I-U CRISPR-associated helicase/endonuclease Cas3 [Pseudoroseomonas globiformis]|uniref:Type I-U CRISPR-associated helicase/endonuclease Cas3 n=1 Tax=Teichococcus globiformis TaxID=2307229 RepID=A0ABV7G5N3_9PROT
MSLPALREADFAAFFRAVHGVAPFPWQSRLLQQVLATGWPSLCDLPPASGKTAVIDIAVFALALALSEAPRRMPMRIAFVVDRRLVVDEAHVRARRLAEYLAEALTGERQRDPDGAVLARVAARLAALGGTGLPLQVSVLRGGLPQDRAWAASVHQPTVLLSTVDQVGSRLLFRGYGVSPRMAPVQAGLLGEDCLILLDEAHLSTAFAQTLQAVTALRRRATQPLDLPFAAVTLSATPGPGTAMEARFALDMDTAGPDRAGAPLLHRRLAARKQARLDRAPATGNSDKQARVFVDRARHCAEDPRVRVIGIVVNRVRLARRIHDLLVQAVGEAGEDPATGGSLLLTGRCRPWDRDQLLGLNQPADPTSMARIIDRLCCGRDRALQAGHRPLFVVGTQAIEAGADFDFDALVSEMAPWSVLRQRLGRLDRDGALGHSTAWMLCTFKLPAADPAAQDRLYGTAGWTTRQWLWQRAGGDGAAQKAPPGLLELGVDGQADLGLPPEATILATADAPCLTPSILGLFAQTTPRPHPDPDPALWLHGPRSGPADLQLVWRADTPLDEDPSAWAAYGEVLAAVPPVAAEVLALPLGVARAWLAQRLADSADLEAEPVEAQGGSEIVQGRKVYVWRSTEGSALTDVEVLRPGDTVILPAAWGGCDRFGWVPEPSTPPTPVPDIAEPAIRQARGRHVLRLHPGLLPAAKWHRARALLSAMTPEEPIRSLLGALRETLPDLPFAALGAAPRLLAYADNGSLAEGVVLRGGDPGGLVEAATPPVRLEAHGAAVGQRATAAARAVGLPGERVDDLALAARWHDLGKAEPRFQAMLRGSSLLAALSRPALAKSPQPPQSRTVFLNRLARVGLPQGLRHEAWSVALLQGSDLLRDALDPDLVLWLVGTHHGHGRPFFAAMDDPAPPFPELLVMVQAMTGPLRLRARTRHDLQALSSGWTARFDPLMARYGVWGLAYLEAALRLADAQQSRHEALASTAMPVAAEPHPACAAP